MSIRILLVDDHKLIREGIRVLLERHPDMEVVAEAEDGQIAVKLVQKLLPDVVIMDIAMPVLNGIEATRQIVTKHPGVKVLILSIHTDRLLVTESMRAGALGYMLKDCAFEELACAIYAVVSNQIYLSPMAAGFVIKDDICLSITRSGYSDLTSREREVLQLLSQGMTTKQIASSLQLSVKTIETYRRQILKKLDIHNVVELTKYAVCEKSTPNET
ncbi:MAG: response regulator transcription factor [Nitrospirota bacterium]|nr:response regulator transcription factor [Nitrospirota bacterium]MDH5767774.1 response regulator transcription factor [Nitrospirota bacterium]